jgi:uncharacterized protein (DUF1810 family)
MLDPYKLKRFEDAQADTYAAAHGEITRGRKQTHWMWFIFPQLRGLGSSRMAQSYGISSIDEARAYLDHPVLGQRLLECVTALQDLPPARAEDVLGAVDAMKLRSSLTLFLRAGGGVLFEAALERWFSGEPDPATDQIMSHSV